MERRDFLKLGVGAAVAALPVAAVVDESARLATAAGETILNLPNVMKDSIGENARILETRYVDGEVQFLIDYLHQRVTALVIKGKNQGRSYMKTFDELIENKGILIDNWDGEACTLREETEFVHFVG